MRVLTLFFFISFYSCTLKNEEHKVNPVSIELNNQAMSLVRYIDNPDSSEKAISLLEEATSIDSHYFLGHYNKLVFFAQQKQYNKAIYTIEKLIQLKPYAHDLYLTGGVLYERIGDTISSEDYFAKSLIICNNVLDTMKSGNADYLMLVIHKTANLTMLGRDLEKEMFLQNIAHKLFENNHFDSTVEREIINLNEFEKEDIINKYTP